MNMQCTVTPLAWECSIAGSNEAAQLSSSCWQTRIRQIWIQASLTAQIST